MEYEEEVKKIRDFKSYYFNKMYQQEFELNPKKLHQEAINYCDENIKRLKAGKQEEYTNHLIKVLKKMRENNLKNVKENN